MIFINFAENIILRLYIQPVVSYKLMKYNICNLSRIVGVIIFCIATFTISSCKKDVTSSFPGDFKSLPTDKKMEYLMANMRPDSVALYICDAAMGKKYDSRIELAEAKAYAYDHYNEEQILAFEQACSDYKEDLPLNEKVKFIKLEAAEDPDMYSYELGLKYIGKIREDKKDIKQVEEELDKLMKECQTDKDFYKRFMKGFKTALDYDRHHDLDDKIYLKFISYPDSI